MPPRKKASTATVATPLLPPNLDHPCFEQVVKVVPGDRTLHSSSYHSFFTSTTFDHSNSTTTGDCAVDVPPKKKKQKTSNASTSINLPRPVSNSYRVELVQDRLLKWFDERRESRGMPWRKDGDPREMKRKERSQRGYEVWVSEIMLQQTQVATVIPYFLRWISKFPTVDVLAQSTIDEVNVVWTGLGYYSRAKRLLEGAKTVVRDFDGLVPETVEELLQIDGIGPYSAGAISSVAFGKRSALVDGNVTRVLSRLTALHAPSTAKTTTSFIWSLADLLVPDQLPATSSPSDTTDQRGIKNRPGSWNQGLMELGSTVCTPKNPKCGECPLNEECLAYNEARFVAHRKRSLAELEKRRGGSPSKEKIKDLEDLCTLCVPLLPPTATSSESLRHSVELYPMAKERKKSREEETAVCIVEWICDSPSISSSSSSSSAPVEKKKKVLLMKRPEKGLLAGLYEFPSVDLPVSTATSPSSSSTRLRLLDKLLDSLLVDYDSLNLSIVSNPSSSSKSPSSSSVTTSNSKDIDSPIRLKQDLFETMDSVTQAYSHLVRTYHPIRIVITSSTLPRLKKETKRTSTINGYEKKKLQKKKRKSGDDDSSDEDDDEDVESELVQSIAGQGKWIDFDQVEGESLGGAMQKVWKARITGEGKSIKKETLDKKKKTNKKEKEEREGGKGQRTLSGFFTKSSAGEKEKDITLSMGKKKVGDSKATLLDTIEVEEGDDEEIIIVEPVERRSRNTDGRASGEKDVKVKVDEAAVEKRVYKKRTIAASSDEEE